MPLSPGQRASAYDEHVLERLAQEPIVQRESRYRFEGGLLARRYRVRRNECAAHSRTYAFAKIARGEAGCIADDERVTETYCLDRFAQIVTVPLRLQGIPSY